MGIFREMEVIEAMNGMDGMERLVVTEMMDRLHTFINNKEMPFYESLAFKWLNKEWPKEKRICEVCNVKKYTLLPEIKGEICEKCGERIYEKCFHHSKPFYEVKVVCENCGNTIFELLRVMGIYPILER